MILEGIVTTLSLEGEVNVAPMGPTVDGEQWDRFLLRPFPTSTTYQNLKRHGEGVLHVTDDVLLLARAAVGKLEPPPLRPAERVQGRVLVDCCRFFEFRVKSMDEAEQRVRIEAEVVHTGRVRDGFGFNRGKHAVVEAAILATRLHLLPRADIEAEFQKFAILVEKTGGRQEREAFEFLNEYVKSEASGAASVRR